MTPEQELAYLKAASSEDVCRYLASKVRRARTKSKESQEQFALRSGISIRTYKRFESYGRANLETFIKVLLALERTHYFVPLFAADTPTVKKPTMLDRITALKETKRD